MLTSLAYAQSGDSGVTNLTMVLVAALIVGLTAILAAVPIMITRRRRHRFAEFIVTLVLVWGLITAGDLLYTQQSQMNWSKEYQIRLQSGYYDPRDTSDAPQLPWMLWGGLLLAYAAILAWSLSRQAGGSRNPNHL